MSKSDIAKDFFGRGFNCSQSVIAAFCEELDLDLDTALKVSSGFGGGMRMGETCGAVTGALMVIGLKYGFSKEENIAAAKEEAYSKVREFISEFKNKNNSAICKELLGYDISIEEGMKEARDKGLFKTMCPKLVGDAVEVLGGML